MLKINDLHTRVASNQERLIMVRVQCLLKLNVLILTGIFVFSIESFKTLKWMKAMQFSVGIKHEKNEF